MQERGNGKEKENERACSKGRRKRRKGEWWRRALNKIKESRKRRSAEERGMKDGGSRGREETRKEKNSNKENF